MDQQFKYLIIIYAVSAIVSILYGYITRYTSFLPTGTDKRYDELVNEYIEKKTRKICPRIDCGFWCWSHIIMYIFLGYYAPKYWYISFYAGAIFESIEKFLEKYIAVVADHRDVWLNTLGLIIGMVIRFNTG